MKYTQIIISLISTLTVCGCSKWPPSEQELRAYFLEHQSNMESLRQNLVDSKYFTVGTTFGNVAYANYFEGDPISGESSRSERPPNEKEWLLLLNSSAVKAVHREFRSMRYTDEVLVDFPFCSDRTCGFSRGMTRINSEWTAGYYHSTEVGSRIKECEAAFATAQCGNCVVPLGGDWWIRYWWAPEDLTPDATEAWLNGELTEDQYFEIRGKADDQCFAAGATLIEDSEEL